MSEQCPAGCCPHDGASPDAGCPDDLPGVPLSERAAHLYACQMLSTCKIAAVTGTERQRITRLLRKAGIAVKPYGAGRRLTRRTAEDHRLDQLMARLYQEQRMPSPQIAELTGMSEWAVRSRLRARGVPIRTRGRHNREDRVIISPDDLAALYLQDGLFRRVLNQHHVPMVTQAGPIWKRFPAPHQLTAGLVTDLYEGCGLSLHHIELLTGRPGAAVGAVPRASGIQLRPAGGRSPFMHRWREGSA